MLARISGFKKTVQVDSQKTEPSLSRTDRALEVRKRLYTAFYPCASHLNEQNFYFVQFLANLPMDIPSALLV
jgi:hypothetical protein